MKFKRIILAAVFGVLLLSTASMAYAATDEAEYEHQVPNEKNEQEAAVSEEESIIEAYTDGDLSPAASTRSIWTSAISFKKTSPQRARAGVSLSASSNVTKLTAKLELYKKTSGTYKSTGKRVTLKSNRNELLGAAVFAVNKKSSYKLYVTVTEYKGNKKSTKAPMSCTLKKNGY